MSAFFGLQGLSGGAVPNLKPIPTWRNRFPKRSIQIGQRGEVQPEIPFLLEGWLLPFLSASLAGSAGAYTYAADTPVAGVNTHTILQGTTPFNSLGFEWNYDAANALFFDGASVNRMAFNFPRGDTPRICGIFSRVSGSTASRVSVYATP